MLKGANGNTNSKTTWKTVFPLSDPGLRLRLNYASAARMLIRLTGPRNFPSDFCKLKISYRLTELLEILMGLL